MSIVALETYLAPIKGYFAQEGVNEISINRQREVWVEKFGDMTCYEVPEFTLDHLKALARLIAQSTEQRISEETPLLSANLPDGYRVQIVFPPACEAGTVAYSIRKQSSLSLDLDGYEALGAFQTTAVRKVENTIDKKLRELLDSGQIKEFIRTAVLARKNMIISGGTSTGKTTFMNAVMKAIPPVERIITCEDAREINVDHIKNRVHLMASKGGQGRANVTM